MKQWMWLKYVMCSEQVICRSYLFQPTVTRYCEPFWLDKKFLVSVCKIWMWTLCPSVGQEIQRLLCQVLQECNIWEDRQKCPSCQNKLLHIKFKKWNYENIKLAEINFINALTEFYKYKTVTNNCPHRMSFITRFVYVWPFSWFKRCFFLT